MPEANCMNKRGEGCSGGCCHCMNAPNCPDKSCYQCRTGECPTGETPDLSGKADCCCGGSGCGGRGEPCGNCGCYCGGCLRADAQVRSCCSIGDKKEETETIYTFVGEKFGKIISCTLAEAIQLGLVRKVK